MTAQKPKTLIDHYIRLRDAKAQREEAAKQELRKYAKAMEAIEDQLLKAMQAEGTESVRTEAGTAYRYVKHQARVASKDDFFQFVKDHDAWNFVESRVKKTDAVAYMEEHQMPPPGIDIVSFESVGFRKR